MEALGCAGTVSFITRLDDIGQSTKLTAVIK